MKGSYLLSLFGLLIVSVTSFAQVKIIGGSVVEASDPISKMTVGIRFVNPDHNYYATCTGTILSENLILTAAHCMFREQTPISPKEIYILYGTDMNLRQVTGKVDHIHVSKDYTGDIQGQNISDIALLKLRTKVPDSHYPVTALDSSLDLKLNNLITLAGYGKTDYETDTGTGVLRKVDLLVKDILAEEFITFAFGKSGCQGDSGGPAFLKKSEGLFYVGVTSRVVKGCKNDNIITYVQRMGDFFSDAFNELFAFNKYNTKTMSKNGISNFYALSHLNDDIDTDEPWVGHCYSNAKKADMGMFFSLTEDTSEEGRYRLFANFNSNVDHYNLETVRKLKEQAAATQGLLSENGSTSLHFTNGSGQKYSVRFFGEHLTALVTNPGEVKPSLTCFGKRFE